MKKKFIFLAMLLLTVLGGVNLNVLNAQEQYRIKVVGNNLYSGVGVGQYVHVFNNDEHTGGTNGGVGVAEYQESDRQIFTLEETGTSGKYYVKSATGYYIYFQTWNVDAYSTYYKSAVGIDLGGETFYMMNGSKYVKVEVVPSANNGIYLFGDQTSTSNAAYFSLEPVLVDDGIIPAAPTNLVATAIDHKSISLTWTAGDENALKYNIYQGDVNIASTSGTSYTVEDLDAETNYCFTVEAVRGVNVSGSHSNEACATTGVAPKTQKIIFSLKDSYGDGWNGNKLTISYEGFSEDLTVSNGVSASYERELPQGAEVTLKYQNTGYYQSENSFVIKYEDGEVIWSKNQGELSSEISHTFTVRSNELFVSVSADRTETYFVAGGTVKLAASARGGAGNYSYSWTPSTGLDDATSATPIFTPTEIGSYSFICTVTDAVGDAVSEEITITVLETPEGPQTIAIGSASATNNYLPIATYYFQSYSQQIYTSDEIGFSFPGSVISKIKLYSNGTNLQRNVRIYMLNTDKESFSGTSDWVKNVTDENKVYDGTITTTSTIEIPISDFVYEGGNIILCFHDITGTAPSRTSFNVYPTSGRALVRYVDSNTIWDLTTMSGGGAYSYNNQIEFTIEVPKKDVAISTDTITFGTLRGGNYWTERPGVEPVEIIADPTGGAVVTSIELLDDSFFSLSDNIDLTADPITFNVYCGDAKSASAGDKSTSVRITYDGGETKDIAVSATVYTPAQGDVMELAKEITFAADGSYTDNVTGMHDDYILPGEENDGNAPDAVYTFTLTEDAIISASINGGTNSNIAIYNANDLQGSGPSSDNNDVGVEMNVTPATPTTFFSGFETGDFTGWQNIDGDGDGNVWEIATGGYASSAYKAVSHSYTSTNLYPENYLITDQKYLITENSVLTVCAASHSSDYLDGYKVMVSGTGEIGTFTEVEAITAGTVNDLVLYETELGAYADMELYIAINHYTDAMWALYIDNVELTDGSSQARSLVQANAATSQIEEVEYKAGTYYLVAASDSDNFTLSVTKSKLQAPEIVEYVYPENDARGLVNPKLEWKLGKFTKEYQLLLGTTNPPTDVAVDWTSELAFVYMTSDLSSNTRYYWQVNEKNTVGVTEGPVYSFVTLLDIPQNIYASPMQIYEGDYTEIYWSEPENTNGFLYYNIYVNEELLEGELEDTYYEMWGLDHNINGHTISVTAVYDNDLGESEHATCNVYVGGYTDITINVKNGVGDPLPNANVSLQYGYNEFNIEIPAYHFTTDENGQVKETVKIVSVGSPYLVTVSKALYNSATAWLDNGVTTLDITMEMAPPSGLTATPQGIFYGDPVTVAWDSYDYAEDPKYHVWVNGVQHNTEAISDTSYVITDLPYNVNGNEIAVQVEHELGKSSLSYPVYVKVAGKFIAKFNVKDSYDETLAKPIEGATVTIKNSGFVDQLGNVIPEYTITTDAEGIATIALPLFPNSNYAYYEVEITKGLYNKYSDYITSYAQISNGSVIERNIVMTLPTPESVQVVEGHYFVGDDVVLTWEAPAFSNRAFLGYNIYQSSGNYYDSEEVKLNDVIVTETTYSISGLEYGSYNFSVSAVYDEGESATMSAYVKVTDYGKLVGTVVNAEGKALKDATISVTGYDEFNEEQTYSGYTTDRNGKFVIENIRLSGWEGYTVKATKFDYIDYVSSNEDQTNAYVTYNADGVASEVTVVMQSNPAISMNVTASDNDTVAAVSWDSPLGAQSYNLYRLDVATDEVTVLGESLDVTNYYDEEWPSLADGDYQYGVSAYMEKSWSFKESFTDGIPADWKTYRTGEASSYYDAWIWKAASVTYDGISAYDGDNGIAMANNNKGTGTTRKAYMVTSLIDLTEAVNPTMSFVYHTPYYNSSYSGTGYTNELKVLVLTEAQGQDAGANGTQLWTNASIYTDWWTNVQVDLSAYQGQKIYIAFENTPKYGNGSSIDYVEITADPEYYTSRINWSDPLVKGAIIYRGEGDWTTAANWSTGEVPTSTDDVTIKGKVTVTGDVEINSITIAKNTGMGMGYGEGEEYSLTLASGSVLTVTNGISNNNYSSSFIINDGAQVYQNYEGVEATFNMLIQNPTDWKDTLNKDGWQMIASPLKGSSASSFVPADTDYDLYKYDGTKELQWVNHKYHADAGIEVTYKFEDKTIPAEFTQIDVDGIPSYKWYAETYSNATYWFNLGINSSLIGSNGCVYSEAQAGTDNYLVSPQIRVGEGSNVTFKAASYYSKSFEQQYITNGNCESVEILISENGNTLATDFVTIETIEVSNGSDLYNSVANKWESYTVDLSEYAGKLVYVAFRHSNAGAQRQNALLLDDIQLVSGAFDVFDEYFEQGRAYLASYEWEDTATFTGTLNHETSFNFNNLTYNSENIYNNFHLLGNPFSFDMDWANIRLTDVYNGYATVSYDGSYEYHTSGTIPVGDGFFVKTTGNNPSVSVSNVRTRSAKASNINLIATGNEGSDNIIMSFGGEEEEGFAKLDNLNENIAELYILNEGRRYGIKSYDEDVEEIEVKFAPKRMGSYTINAIAEGDFNSVILVDRMEGIETNLLLEGYTFMAREKDARDRFTIKLSKNGVQAGDDFVYQSGDELIINGAGTVQIIDVMGRIVYSSDVESCNSRINVSGLKSATYMVRNINGNEVKTQKIVVL